MKSKIDINDKNQKIVCIVESPNKKATITSIFKAAGYNNVRVLASVGHITHIQDDPKSYCNTGIFPDKDFKINYKIMSDKKKVVDELKSAIEKADLVLLATDPDREGEAISWHLKEQLGLTQSKYRRITFHEITKPAILKALEESRKIDDDLVDAAKARGVVDKLIGYALSPIAQINVDSKSVGRCQSAGLKLITERENEIKNFIPETYYELYVHFTKNDNEFKAKYIGTMTKPIKKFDKQEDCLKVMKECEGGKYLISSITPKKINENPKPPFITSTFQQEVNKVFGLSVDTAMSLAQKLFEGININGEHIALCTYLRTDDTTMSPEFIETLSQYITNNYSKKYLGTVKTDKKAENVQAGHECFRVIDPEMTPEKLQKYISDDLLIKVYRLIWRRTIASLMAPAVISDTQYNIMTGEHLFSMHSREVIFDGYRAIYSQEDEVEDDNPTVKETFVMNEQLQNTSLKMEEKTTQPPKRYNQASFIKELEKRGIGRPSTFASIVKTILAEDRGYCNVENKLIIPTDKGMALSEFLDKYFNNVISITYTSEMENKLDLIANGKEKLSDFLQSFYSQLQTTIKDSGVPLQRSSSGGVCPECGAPLKYRKGIYGPFWGCSNYPKCKYVKNISKNTSKTGNTVDKKK